MSYSMPNNYLPPPQPSGYYNQSAHLAPLPSLHLPSNNSRAPTEASQRKRPKYTRSKTGCLTCRIKKVKCDESKPTCVRCSHGQRDCTWPEGVATRKKPASRKDSVDGDARPSTAGSSGLSDGSTPPIRERSPPRRHLDLLPLPPRRTGDPYGYSQSLPNHERGSPYIYPSPGPDALPALNATYHSRYEQSPSGTHHSRQNMTAPYRSSYSHHEHWHTPSESYYHPVPERMQGSPNESHHRYQ